MTEDVLASGLSTLGLHLSEEQQTQLLAYQSLIQKWNKVYNLTALREQEQILTHHLLDSLAALPAIESTLASQSLLPSQQIDQLDVLDVGSGGGLPGIAWAIARPQWQVTCVDAVAKKVTFIRQVAVELGLRQLNAVHSRVEQINHPSGWSIITSRAFASLLDFVTLTSPLLNTSGCWVALKGKMPHEEMAALPPEVEVFHVEQLQVPGLDAERCLIWMRKRH